MKKIKLGCFLGFGLMFMLLWVGCGEKSTPSGPTESSDGTETQLAPPSVNQPKGPRTALDVLHQMGTVADDLVPLTPATGNTNCDANALSQIGEEKVFLLGYGMVKRVSAASKTGIINENRLADDSTSIASLEIELLEDILSPENRYFVLARPLERVEPEMTGPQSFVGGNESGEAWLVDLEAHKILCVKAYSAKNSRQVEFSTNDINFSDGEVLKDLMLNIRAAIEAAFHAENPNLKFK